MPERPPQDQLPGRKTPAKGVRIQHGKPTILFLTVCTKDRVPWLAQEPVQTSLETIWRKADAWLVGNYLLMPDHLHFFCAPRDLRFTVEKWITFWKREFGRSHLDQDWQWQRGAFHRRLRHPRDYQEKWQYVYENPVRQGLVKDASDWPYSGIIHQLTW